MEPFTEFDAYVEQKLKHYATKAEFEQLRTEIARVESRLIKWVVGTGIALALLIVAAIAVIANIMLAVSAN